MVFPQGKAFLYILVFLLSIRIKNHRVLLLVHSRLTGQSSYVLCFLFLSQLTALHLAFYRGSMVSFSIHVVRCGSSSSTSAGVGVVLCYALPGPSLDLGQFLGNSGAYHTRSSDHRTTLYCRSDNGWCSQ